MEREQKQVGIVKGMINSEVLESLRRKPPPEPRVNKLPEAIAEKKPLFEDRLQESTSSDTEDNDNLVVVQNSGKKRSQSLQDNCSLSERDLLHTLGKLHGKLATAQLRARTKRMQADMTAEERDDEARTKAKQLESIMNLMMQNKEKFGMNSEDDIKEQLNMYNF
ncbi:hypothetical protein OESDEN_08089 [Oesophagostomum dentatum]|uniref:Matrix-remodeling-associated protein 7 helical domain-containing protein n=1 Tax=Oesophagostomum dentatum TaxID=61180 RepID=A0A0B1T8B3_OESDE|nr:hypothetical protein OESDEN_08089 [Oesophagostomum dentatum]